MKSTIKKYGIVFLLLLAFFQQVGAGLYVHNLVHDKRDLHTQHKEATTEINFACSCVDNYLTPFTEAAALVLERPVRVFTTNPVFFSEAIIFSPVIYAAFRGPPVFIG